MSEATTVEAEPAEGGRGILPGLLLGIAAAALGCVAWVLAYRAGQVAAALVALAVGAAVGLVLRRGGRGGWLGGAIGVVLVVLSAVVGSNLAQRHELIAGIDRLQHDWATLRVDPTAPGGGTSQGEPLSDAPGCAARPSGFIPPPEVLVVLPPEALLCMSAKELATVWETLPDDKKEELPAEARAAVEAELAGTPEEQLARSRAEYEGAAYDIPDAVLACAPPPDFSQPDAQSGLGFAGGVPLILARAELFDENRERGDGLEVETPSPSCFVRENARDNPLEPLSWATGALLAFMIPFRRRTEG